jgi:hypothetical protein
VVIKKKGGYAVRRGLRKPSKLGHHKGGESSTSPPRNPREVIEGGIRDGTFTNATSGHQLMGTKGRKMLNAMKQAGNKGRRKGEVPEKGRASGKELTTTKTKDERGKSEYTPAILAKSGSKSRMLSRFNSKDIFIPCVNNISTIRRVA